MSTVTERTADVSALSIDKLRSRMTGRLLTPDQDGYEDARSIWNAMITTRPAIIGLPETNRDVAELIRFATRERLLLSARGGGHNIAGTALAENGLTINLSRLRDVAYDPKRNRVTVGGGATWADVDSALEPYGLAVPGGMISTTGVAGLTLGGGLGWLTRSAGYSAERLTSATIVTADGEIQTISERVEPDLFWAIRGGGGNFGIVTQFEFEPVRLGPEIAGGMTLWPIDMAPEVIDLFRRECASAPDELTHGMLFLTAPPAPFLPPEAHGKPLVGIAGMYAGPVETGMRALEPIKQFGRAVADLIAPKPFRVLQTMFDAGQPFGRRYYWKSIYFDDFSDDVKSALLAHGTHFRSPTSAILLPHLGGAPARSASGATAISHLDQEFLVNYEASWEDPNQDGELIGWAKENYDSVSSYATGQYVNLMTADEVRDPSRVAYEPELLTRLQRIKGQYDPENVFRSNKNIAPVPA